MYCERYELQAESCLSFLYIGWRGRTFYKSDNCPSWWPKDVAFSPLIGIFYSQVLSTKPDSKYVVNTVEPRLSEHLVSTPRPDG